MRHQRQAAVRLGQAAIHATGAVGKYTVSQQSFQQALGFAHTVASLHTDETQQSRADARNARAADNNLGTRDTLQQCDHASRAAKASVVLTSASTIPGSLAEWPAPAITISSACGQTLCSVKA